MKEAFEKIQKRLREKYNDYSKVRVDYAEGLRDGYIGAMTIVSEVEAEYEDDVCEWKNEKGMFIQNPHTGRKFSNEPSMMNVYCNTCGKKIKVVE